MKTGNGFDLIPTPAWVIAGLALVAPAVLFTLFFGPAFPDFQFSFQTVVGIAIGVFLAAHVLLCGYVYGDARRRGMPAGIWAAITILVPNGVGFVLYFVLRKPIVHPCPGCGRDVAADAAFCQMCGAAQVQNLTTA